jgi:integrase/recombinase XerD
MLQEGVDLYLASLARKKRGENNSNTIVAYRNDLHQLCVYLANFGLEDWRQVTREHINAYLLGMRDAHNYRPATIARKLASLKTFFRYMHSSGALDSSPVEDLDIPHIRKEPPQVLSQEQIVRLFRQVVIDNPVGRRDFALIALLYTTGMRVSELVALNLNDLDIADKTMNCPGRSGKSHRGQEVHLLLPVVEALQSYLHLARQQLIRHHADEPALFVNHHGERLTRQGFWLIVKGYARQAGITEITPQVLRHSFVAHVPLSGKEPRTIQELLGAAQFATVRTQ